MLRRSLWIVCQSDGRHRRHASPDALRTHFQTELQDAVAVIAYCPSDAGRWRASARDLSGYISHHDFGIQVFQHGDRAAVHGISAVQTGRLVRCRHRPRPRPAASMSAACLTGDGCTCATPAPSRPLGHRSCVGRFPEAQSRADTDNAAADNAAAFAGARSTTPPCRGNPGGRRSAGPPPRARSCPVSKWSTMVHPLPGDRPGCQERPRRARNSGRAGSAAHLVSVAVKGAARSPSYRGSPLALLSSCDDPF
jgi:hypothetical protein